MRQTIDRLLEGKFDYDKGNLDFSVSRIEHNLSPDELYTGSFRIIGTIGKAISGYLYSTDPRMQLLSDSFSGNLDEIGYTFTARGLEGGDVIKGEIQVISNQGEYYLPFVVSIAHKTLESSLGCIKNLFHFANLARTNWEEAVNLFYSEEFAELFTGNDRQYLRAYTGLSRYFGNEQNVEEFLLEIKKKQPTEYLVENSNIVVEAPESEVQEYIDITRNGWGYTSLTVSADAPFIVLSKDNLTDNDFLGNYLHYPILIDPLRLHEGTNFGTITFANAFTSFTVNVKVTGNMILRPDISKDTEYKHILIDMVTYYKAFRLKKISTDTWLAETGRLVDRLQSLKPEARVPRMFKAQLLITEERYNEAKWILDQVENGFAETRDYAGADWAYFLYLTTLVNREESYIDQITDEVENIYNRDNSQWLVAWLLLYLSAEYAVSPTKKWLFIENQLSLNCTSPAMYVEAANMLVVTPTLLTKLDNVALRVLRFMVKEEMVTPELARQVVYLAGTGRWFSDSLIDVLRACYDILPDNLTLSAMCNLLIANDRKGPEYFQWYKLGLEEEARVTKIYEYYMMSLDISRINKLPKMVYMYFSYQVELDWQHTAYLYARVIENREEMEDIFKSYKESIDRFTINQIAEGHMNRDLAIIYRFVLSENVMSEGMAVKLANLIFTHRISVEAGNVSRVIIYQSREQVEESYPIENGEAYVPIYNRDFTLLFEDDISNRYMSSIEYDIEKLMVPGKLANMLLPYVNDNLSFDVYACECSSEMVEITDENRGRYQRILDSQDIEKNYKTDIRTKLMQYYYDNDQILELDGVLESLNPEDMGLKERNTCIRFMITRGMYDKAIDWIVDYGMEGIEARDLLKLCSNLISRGDFTPNPKVTSITMACFNRGKYDETILEYLVDNYEGMTKDMRRIFKAAENFNIDVNSMCEKLIVQMLYTGYYVAERMSIYKTYLAGGASGDIQLAFLAQCAYDYFVKGQLTESFVFEEINRLKAHGEPMQQVLMLAYLNYYSENRDMMDDAIKANTAEFLDKLLRDGIYFSFFKEFMEQGVEEINRFADKTFIEYKTEPGKEVWIHYIVERGDDTSGEYITAKMPDMYGGIHSKPFVLFFGETLLYYITEETEGDEQLTESGSVGKSDIGTDISTSRFSEINDIVIAHTLKDYEALEHLIYEYSRKEFLIEKLFTMK